MNINKGTKNATLVNLPPELKLAYDAVANAKLLVGRSHKAHRQLEIATKMLLLVAEKQLAKKEINGCMDEIVRESIKKAKKQVDNF